EEPALKPGWNNRRRGGRAPGKKARRGSSRAADKRRCSSAPTGGDDNQSSGIEYRAVSGQRRAEAATPGRVCRGCHPPSNARKEAEGARGIICAPFVRWDGTGSGPNRFGTGASTATTARKEVAGNDGEPGWTGRGTGTGGDRVERTVECHGSGSR